MKNNSPKIIGTVKRCHQVCAMLMTSTDLDEISAALSGKSPLPVYVQAIPAIIRLDERSQEPVYEKP